MMERRWAGKSCPSFSHVARPGRCDGCLAEAEGPVAVLRTALRSEARDQAQVPSVWVTLTQPDGGLALLRGETREPEKVPSRGGAQ